MRKLILASSLFLFAQSAYSFVNAEAFYGKRWYDNSEFKSSGDMVSLGLNLDPIPLPVSAGIGYGHTELKASDFNLKNIAYDELSFNIKAWVPFVPIITPYARVSAPLVARLRETTKGSHTHLTAVRGYDLGVGIAYRLLPLIHLEIEFRESFAKDNDALRMNSHLLLFGLAVGI